MKHLCTTQWLEKKVRRLVLVKKKSPCAPVKARLRNLNNILTKYIIREKSCVGVTGGKWSRRGKRNKQDFLSPQSRGKSRSYKQPPWWLFLFSSSSSSCPAVNPGRNFWTSIRNGTTEKAVRSGGGGSAWEAFTNSGMKICLLRPWGETHSAHSWVLFLDSWEAAEIFGKKNGFRDNQLEYPVAEANSGNQRQRITLWWRVICFLI